MYFVACAVYSSNGDRNEHNLPNLARGLVYSQHKQGGQKQIFAKMYNIAQIPCVFGKAIRGHGGKEKYGSGQDYGGGIKEFPVFQNGSLAFICLIGHVLFCNCAAWGIDRTTAPDLGFIRYIISDMRRQINIAGGVLF